MHTYQPPKRDGDPFTVGYYVPDRVGDNPEEHTWVALKDFSTETEAAAYVSYLNGGFTPDASHASAAERQRRKRARDAAKRGAR